MQERRDPGDLKEKECGITKRLHVNVPLANTPINMHQTQTTIIVQIPS